MANDPYTDDQYDDSYEDVHGDEPVRDEYVDDATDDTFFPTSIGNSLYPSWGTYDDDNLADDDYDAYDEQEAYEYDDYDEVGDDDSWWDEGLIGTVLLAGLVLFLFPEPATSAAGIGLLVVGVLAWIFDWMA